MKIYSNSMENDIEWEENLRFKKVLAGVLLWY